MVNRGLSQCGVLCLILRQFRATHGSMGVKEPESSLLQRGS